MSHVFSINCRVSWSETTPCNNSRFYAEEKLHPSALHDPRAEFPLDWAFALMRSVTKICTAVETHDAGMVPIALFDVSPTQSYCATSIRVRASALAIKFLVRFLEDFEGWNDGKFYPTESSSHHTSYGGAVKMLPPTGNKNVCSSAFASLCKMTKTRLDDSNRRFWWTRVERLENMIFVWLLHRMRRDRHKSPESYSWTSGVLTVLMREESKVLNKNSELRNLVAMWDNVKVEKHPQKNPAAAPLKVLATRNAFSQQTSPTRTSSSYSSSSSNTSSPCSTRSPSPPADAPVRKAPCVANADLVRLRRCNFPPRMAPEGVPYHASWDPSVPCLSGIVFDPITNLSCVPRGMNLRKDGCMLKSIW